MTESDRSGSRGFNPLFDKPIWLWVAVAAVVATVMAFWATAAGRHPQVAANEIPTISEPLLIPPITQPAPLRPSDLPDH